MYVLLKNKLISLFLFNSFFLVLYPLFSLQNNLSTFKTQSQLSNQTSNDLFEIPVSFSLALLPSPFSFSCASCQPRRSAEAAPSCTRTCCHPSAHSPRMPEASTAAPGLALPTYGTMTATSTGTKQQHRIEKLAQSASDVLLPGDSNAVKRKSK